MSKTFKSMSVEEALECSMAVDGFRCLTLSEDKFPGLLTLRSEVQQAIKISQEINAIKAAELPEGVKAEQLKPLDHYVQNNALFDYVKVMGLQERLFDVLEDLAKDEDMLSDGWKLVPVIWSVQMRTVPADLVHRPKPNPWTDGAAKDAHVDSHGKRPLTEYIVDAARLEDCWKHSPEFRDMASHWMSLYFPNDVGNFTEACLAHLTRDMRRFRYYHTFVQRDSRVAPMLEKDVEEDDKAASTFWSAFDMVPCEALSFWWNLTPSVDECVAKALAFCDPTETEEVKDRAATRKPMPSRPGAGGVKWATHTLCGPELVPKPDQEYEVARRQPFGMVTVFDTRVAPHVAEVDDQRPGAIRVSVEARRLTFAVNTNAFKDAVS